MQEKRSKGSGTAEGDALTDQEYADRMRKAGRVASQALALAGSLAKPGMTTDEIDRAVHRFIVSQGAYPSPLNYKGFPRSICTSGENKHHAWWDGCETWLGVSVLNMDSNLSQEHLRLRWGH